jgi:hypothetical protein
MAYGDSTLQKGSEGDEVVELQMRLAGFRGTVPDGDFGPGTELQVAKFQNDYMKTSASTGIVDAATFDAIDKFAVDFPIDFAVLECPCGICTGFGQGRFEGDYRAGKPIVEAYHLYEYPGIHRMLIWAVRALKFYVPQYNFVINSGYRCAENNKKKNRTSTNHHGKAIDLDVPLGPGEDKQDDMLRSDEIRGILVERSAAQIGWTARNRKALEPSNIAPTWVHYDVRSYDRKFLADKYFCKSLIELDGAPI